MGKNQVENREKPLGNEYLDLLKASFQALGFLIFNNKGMLNNLTGEIKPMGFYTFVFKDSGPGKFIAISPAFFTQSIGDTPLEANDNLKYLIDKQLEKIVTISTDKKATLEEFLKLYGPLEVLEIGLPLLQKYNTEITGIQFLLNHAAIQKKSIFELYWEHFHGGTSEITEITAVYPYFLEIAA